MPKLSEFFGIQILLRPREGLSNTPSRQKPWRDRLEISNLADDNTIRLNGIDAVNKALGHANALRFLSLVRREPTDYVKVSARLYRNQSVDDIFRPAEKEWRG
jgi:hypothetical protein